MKHSKMILALVLALALGLSACGAAAAPKRDGAEIGGPRTEIDSPRSEFDSPRSEIGGLINGFFSEGGGAAEDALADGDYEAEIAWEPKAMSSAPEKTSGDGETPAAPDEPIPEGSEPVDPADPELSDPSEPPETVVAVTEPARPLVLTAAEWRDNDNWPFLTNLVNSQIITFPSYGIDPRNRLLVRAADEAGQPLANETLTLTDEAGTVLWTARTDKDGVAYLFWGADQTPAQVSAGEVSQSVQVRRGDTDPQGTAVMVPAEELSLTLPGSAPAQTGLQVLFIVDTTGSMGDEISYLQMDFTAIAQRVAGPGMTYGAAFYRDRGDEYVTKFEGFTEDPALIQQRINAEYAEGGGDTPEAVAEILSLCLAPEAGWREDCAKLAFLIFDAPPHEGREAELQAAVRAAAEQGIRVVPVVASNAERDTELFGRALAICTGGTYVFLTDDSGVGDSHLEPIVGDYTVELLQDVIVRVIENAKP